LINNNELSQGIVQAQKQISSYYILGYYSTNQALDGRYRRIRIQAADRTAKLDYRPGYYAVEEFKQFTALRPRAPVTGSAAARRPANRPFARDGNQLFFVGERPLLCAN
jgi:hypothetical protein